MTTFITPNEIFLANQILTLEIARHLIGKKVATTSTEYKGNHLDVRIGTIQSIETEWDLAAKEDHSHIDDGKYTTRQDYWKSYMTNDRIKKCQNRLKLISEEGSTLYGTCEKDFFFGSDSDREIYYIEL